MKGNTIFFLLAAACLPSCDEKDEAVSPGREIRPEKLTGTWVVVGEKRHSDGWSQANTDGITTAWQIVNPFGLGMSVASITFNDDQTLFWNAADVEDWEHFVQVWSGLPREQWSTYEVGPSGDTITMTAAFEYVGVVKVTVVEFQASIDSEGRLILQGEQVWLALARKAL